MATKDSLQEMKDLISMVLDDCDKYDYPHVCNMAHNPETRTRVEESIMEMIRKSGVSVQGAIQKLERAYNPNFMED
jgi:hypothetical protein